MGTMAKMFTVYVGVVAAGVAELMYTSHYTSSTLDIINTKTISIYVTIFAALFVLSHYTSSNSPTLTDLCRHAAMLGISPDVYCCVAAITIIAHVGALVTTSHKILTILTSVSVLDHC